MNSDIIFVTEVNSLASESIGYNNAAGTSSYYYTGEMSATDM